MKFFNRTRRGRSKSVDRNHVKNRNASISRPRVQQKQVVSKTSRKKTYKDRSDSSVGSDLPAHDQFEIAVPSKSFASADLGEENRIKIPHLESREDRDAENRSTTDISSITSVSYRAGYYYLRNLKKTKDMENKKSSGCGSGCLPSCSCASCMPCNCSWLTCCCCAEAKTELATQKTTAATEMSSTAKPISQNSLLLDPAPPRPRPSSSDKARHSHGSGRGRSSSKGRRRSGSNRRFAMPDHDNSKGERDSPMYPSLHGNHSLFDELSEDEEMVNKNKGGCRQQQPSQRKLSYHQQQQSQRKSHKKNWLHRRGVTANNDPGYTGGQRARSRSRGRRTQREF